jgi:hypothetical protein
MSQQIIDLGTGPDSQTGDDLYTAFTKVNDNFTELYSVFDGNGITTINANAIISNNIWNSGNVRTNDVFAYGNVETVGYVITAGAFYPNGVPIGDLGSITSNIVPSVNGIYNLGSESYTFSNLYLSNSVVISGANISVENDLLFINDLPVGNYSNTNVASYLPIYDGNTAAILTTTSQPYVTQLGTLTNLDALTANINGNLLVSGNLSVEGNITYFNIRDLSVVDPIISLNTGPNGSPLIANNGFDSGVKTFYYDTQNKEAFFGRIDSTGYFEYYSNVISEIGNIVSGTYGTIRTGNLILTENADITGNITANYFLGNGRNLSGINSLNDGSSNVIVYNNGPVTISSDGVSNVAIFTNVGANIGGDFYVTGTISATEYFGNVSGNITSPGSDTQVIFNDGGLLSASSGLTFNKTTNSVSVSGNLITSSNIVVNGLTVVDNTGNVLTARLEDSGVVVGTYGNSSAVPIITVDSKGRITDINITAVAGVSNVSYDGGDSNLSIFTSAGTVFSVNLGVGTNNSPTFAGATITGNISTDTLSGNISGTSGTFTGNISADTLNGNISGTTGVFTGNISANSLNGNINGDNGEFVGNLITGNITNNGIVITNNLTISNFVSSNLIPEENSLYNIGSLDNRWKDLYLSGSTLYLGNVILSANDDFLSTNNLIISSNANLGNLYVDGIIQTVGITYGSSAEYSGNISANTLNGNVSGSTGVFTGNISANTLTGNISGTTGVFTGNISADTLTGNISGATGVFTGNISANKLNGNISGTTGTFTGNISADKLFAATIGNTGTQLTGTLTTTNQPNITSVGSSLTIGEFNLSNNTISSTSDTITIEPADVGSTGNVIIQGNLRVTGNLTYIDSTIFTVNDKDILLANNTGNISDLNGAGLLIGNASGVNLVTLKYSTSLDSWQTNVGFSPVGNVTLDLGTTTTYWANAYIESLYSTSITGTLQTQAQPNITSVGTLNGLTLSNTLTGTTINASIIGNSGSTLQGSSISVSNSITGNTLQINSSANIGSTLTVSGNISAPYFIGNVVGNITGNLSAAGSDTQILFNDGGLIGANSGLTFNKNTGTLTVLSNVNTGTLNGNISGTTGTFTGNISANTLNGNVSGTTGTFTGNISTDTLNGNISGTTGIFTGNISADTLNGNVSGTTGTFTGNISTDTLNGNISGTTGVFTGNISADTLNGNISGTTGTFTGNVSANTLNGNISGTTGTFTGNISTDTLNGNISGTTGVFTGNISADTLNGNISGTTATFTGNISADTLNGNVSGTTGTFTGNISTDTLNGNISGTTATFTGNISASTLNGNISGTTGVFTGNISADTLNGNISGTTGVFTGNISANNISSTNIIQSSSLIVTANTTVGNLSTSGIISATGNITGENLLTTGLISSTNSADSMSNVTGAVVISGGIGVGKNLYVGNAVGWVYPNSVSAVYQVYNSVTNSLDTIFG